MTAQPGPGAGAGAAGTGAVVSARAAAEAAPVSEPRDGFATYMRWSVLAVAALYASGYSTVGFGLLFFGAVWSLVRGWGWPWAAGPLTLPLGVFGAVLLLSAILSPDRGLALGVTLMLIVSGAVYLGGLTWVFHRVPSTRAVLLRVWAAASAVTALLGLAYSLSHFVRLNGGAVIPGRAEIPRGVGPNGLGTTMVLGSVLALGLGFRARGRERRFWWACSAVSLIGLLVSGSRASLAGWLAGVAYLLWRELGARPRRLAAIVVLGLVVVALAGIATPQLFDRLQYTVSDVSGNRVRIWRTSLAMIAARPLVGTGFGTFETAYDRWKRPGASPEPFAFDLWLNLAVETGLLGLAAAVWVAVAAIRGWRRGRDGPERAAAGAVIGALWVGLLVDQLADNTLSSVSTSAAVWLLLALGCAAAPAGIVRSRGRALPTGAVPDPDVPAGTP